MMAFQTVKGGVGVPTPGPDSAQGRMSRDHAEVRSQGRALTPLALPAEPPMLPYQRQDTGRTRHPPRCLQICRRAEKKVLSYPWEINWT